MRAIQTCLAEKRRYDLSSTFSIAAFFRSIAGSTRFQFGAILIVGEIGKYIRCLLAGERCGYQFYILFLCKFCVFVAAIGSIGGNANLFI